MLRNKLEMTLSLKNLHFNTNEFHRNHLLRSFIDIYILSSKVSEHPQFYELLHFCRSKRTVVTPKSEFPGNNNTIVNNLNQAPGI